jgi:hypothetical protein
LSADASFDIGTWSPDENRETVQAYFEMLANDLLGTPYNKAQHRRSLMRSVNRPEKAIEFKHQNVSAVLLGLGHPWITGYKPARNFQLSLVDSVVEYLHQHPGWFESLAGEVGVPPSVVREPPSLWLGPPPTFQNEPPPVDLTKADAIARKFDVAERDARNRDLGKRGEQLVLLHERRTLGAAGRSDLAKLVRWVADEDGDGAGYDISSFEADGAPRLIEVKTTNGWERTPFHITRNELAVAEEMRDRWHLIRLWNFAREPRAFAIRPPLEAHVALTPTSFLAQLH